MIITEVDRIEVKKVLERFSWPKSKEDIFYNLCFTLMAPQTKFKNNIGVITELKKLDFYKNNIVLNKLSKIVKPVRFYNVKAQRLLAAKKQFDTIWCVIQSGLSTIEKRNVLVQMVNGLGMKATSHFLRNLGYMDLAIIDTHILKFLGCIIPKNKKEYMEIERQFIDLAKQKKMMPAELDAVVWKKYSNTSWENFVY